MAPDAGRRESGTIALLIGAAGHARRAWACIGQPGAMADPPHTGSMAAHFTVRTLALVVLLIGRQPAAQAVRLSATTCHAGPGQLALARHQAAAARHGAPSRSGRSIVDAYISAVRARGIRQDPLQPGLDAQGAGAAVAAARCTVRSARQPGAVQRRSGPGRAAVRHSASRRCSRRPAGRSRKKSSSWAWPSPAAWKRSCCRRSSWACPSNTSWSARSPPSPASSGRSWAWSRPTPR